MFGRWPNSLTRDEKNRLTLPPPLRQLGGRPDGTCELYLGALEAPCVTVMTPDQHAKLQERLAALRPRTREERRAVALLQGAFSFVRADATGRIVIPQNLIELSGLDEDRNAVLIGLPEHAEIWSRSGRLAWEKRFWGSEALADVMDQLHGVPTPPREAELATAGAASGSQDAPGPEPGAE